MAGQKWNHVAAQTTFLSPVFLSPGDVSVDQRLQVLLPVAAAQELGLDLFLHLAQHPLLSLIKEICSS